MVVTKARFNQWHRGAYYVKDQIMDVTEDQGRRLCEAGVAYYDFLPDKNIPTMDNTKKEIEEYLDKEDIEYNEYATKPELLELVNGE